MKRILIVDDEKIIIDYLCSTVQWSTIGITDVLTAYSVMEAKEKIAKFHPDILLCDIELPDGIGHQIIQWAKESDISMVSIILTGHAKFDYAQQAISCGCFGYVLKPIIHDDLVELLTRAVIQVEVSQGLEENDPKNISKIKLARKEFWKEMLRPTTIYSKEALQNLAEQKRVGASAAGDAIIPALLISDFDLSERSSFDIMDDICHTAEEMCRGLICMPIIFNNRTVLIFSGIGTDEEYCKCEVEKVIHRFYALYHEETSAYIGSSCTAEKLYKQYEMLQYCADNSVNSCRALIVDGVRFSSDVYKAPDELYWNKILDEENYPLFENEVVKYIENSIGNGMLNRYMQERFFQETTKLIDHHFVKKELQISLLTRNPDMVKWSAHAGHSVTMLKKWLHGALAILNSNYDKMEQERKMANDPILMAKQYISSHIYENISRVEIAQFVSISEEHLSRKFHQREGITLQKYIQIKKIEESQRLLSETNLSIAEVALSIGMDNFSYFSQLFKKITGYLPLQYRSIKKRTM